MPMSLEEKLDATIGKINRMEKGFDVLDIDIGVTRDRVLLTLFHLWAIGLPLLLLNAAICWMLLRSIYE